MEARARLLACCRCRRPSPFEARVVGRASKIWPILVLGEGVACAREACFARGGGTGARAFVRAAAAIGCFFASSFLSHSSPPLRACAAPSTTSAADLSDSATERYRSPPHACSERVRLQRQQPRAHL